MISEKIVTIAILAVSIGLIIYALVKLQKVINLVNSIIEDTLKRDLNGVRVWSTTKLTMASAWFIVIISYFYDLYKNGFNETAFMVMTGVALGAKVTDAWSKKMNPFVGTINRTEDKDVV